MFHFLYHQGHTVSELNHTFVGSGNANLCRELLQSLIHKADEDQCHQKPCAIGPTYQPSISPDKTFYAVGSFVHAPKGVKGLLPNGTFVPENVIRKADAYCQKVNMLHCFQLLESK